MNRLTKELKKLTLFGGICMLALTASAEQLLTPSILNPLALWTGRSDNGFIEGTNLTTLLDGDTNTTWKGGYRNGYPTLSSPLPFVVSKIEVVTTRPNYSGGSIEIMLVGTCDFLPTGLTVSNDLPSKTIVTLDMPPEFQVPISAIRYRGQFWIELNELTFYGEPIVSTSRVQDLTHSGTLKAYKGNTAVTALGEVTNGVFEAGSGGYHQGNSSYHNIIDHNIIVDFGSTPIKATSAYVAVNPNGYLKYPWASTGTESQFTAPGDLVLFSDFTPTPTNATASSASTSIGHSWVVLPVTNKTVYAYGVRMSNFWGDISEFRILNIGHQPGSVFIIQ